MNSQECPATVKVCKDCKRAKLLSEFYPKRELASGKVLYFAQCKACFAVRSAQSYEKRKEAKLTRCKEYRSENKERIADYLREWYQRNKGEILPKIKAYQALPERKLADTERRANRYTENRSEIRARQNAANATPEGRAKQIERYRKHYAENKAYYVAQANKRRAAEKNAMPSWSNAKDCLELYKLARRLTLETGVRHVVDHIVPLRGRKVSGLHVAWNLQVITEAQNLRKFNHFDGR